MTPKRKGTTGEDMGKKDRTKEVDLSTLITYFEIHNRSEQKSPKTVLWYNEVLGMLGDWLAKEGRSTKVGAISELDQRRFILHLQARPGLRGREAASTHTVANRVRALKAFFTWLHQRRYLRENPVAELRVPRTDELLPEPLTPEEIQRLFACLNADTALGARNHAILSLMLDTGLRLNELTSLPEEDVHLEQRYVKPMGKGGKERLIPFGLGCQKSLAHYYHFFRPQPALPHVSRFFLAIDGRPMAKSAINSLFVRLAARSGVERLHPHLLRHTYATYFLLNGGDVFSLQQNLGHTSLEMVRRYVHIASRTAVVKNQSYSPMDRMGLKGVRSNSHAFSTEGFPRHIYPNAGFRRKRQQKGAPPPARASRRAAPGAAPIWPCPRLMRGAYPAESRSSSTSQMEMGSFPSARAKAIMSTTSRLGLRLWPDSSLRR
ncbi:MAG: tyrosine-type recombinase/integrase [Chloroflexi bacterium]|nr:tyrosine-type recombinase/integrase [Chloroflexota bacterium]